MDSNVEIVAPICQGLASCQTGEVWVSLTSNDGRAWVDAIDQHDRLGDTVRGETGDVGKVEINLYNQ